MGLVVVFLFCALFLWLGRWLHSHGETVYKVLQTLMGTGFYPDDSNRKVFIMGSYRKIGLFIMCASVLIFVWLALGQIYLRLFGK